MVLLSKSIKLVGEGVFAVLAVLDIAGQAFDAKFGDALERSLFVVAVSLDGLNEVRNEVAAAAQLHVDAAPGLLHEDLSPDQQVEGEDSPANQQKACNAQESYRHGPGRGNAKRNGKGPQRNERVHAR